MANKIAFIYSYKPEEAWSTPYSLALEFQKRGWEVQIFSLISSTGNYTESGIQMMLDQINAGYYIPDIIMYMDWGRFDSALLDKEKSKGSFWIQEAGDEPQNFHLNFPKSDRFHLVLSPDYESTQKYMDAGRNALWFTHWADTEIHKTSLFIVTKYDAVSTRGWGSSGILDQLQHDLKDRFFNQNGFLGEDHTKVMHSGRMIVQNSRHHEITRRIFEGMACGKMVLTDKLPQKTHLEDLFKDKEDIVYYTSYEDLRSKIDYYLANPGEREKIATSGHLKVLRYHTQFQRVDTILKQFRTWSRSK
jgi:hypothetical protein